MTRLRAVTISFCMVAWAAPGHGQVPHAGQPAEATRSAADEKREALEHKFTLVFRMLYQSPGARRVDDSDHPGAKALLAQAREQFSASRRELLGADAGAADGMLNRALALFRQATQLVPDPAQAAEARRVRYTRALDEIQAFQGSHLLALQHAGAQGAAAGRAPEIEQVRGLIHRAQGLAEQDRHDEAIGVLERARDLIVGSVARLLASATVVYERKFPSLQAEFEFESARHSSFEDLVPIAMAKYRPDPGATRAIGELVDKSRRTRNLAREQALHGDFRTGIGTLQEATVLLERALEHAGLALPK